MTFVMPIALHELSGFSRGGDDLDFSMPQAPSARGTAN